MNASKLKVLPEWFPVDPHVFAWDAEIKRLGKAGMTYSAIGAHILEHYGKLFTPSRIGKRLRRMGVSTTAARRGESKESRAFMALVHNQTKKRKGILKDMGAFQMRVAREGRDTYKARRIK